MDFHSLSRKELQALCKINKIPANTPNYVMAEALKALESVEGADDSTREDAQEIPKKEEAIQPRTRTRRGAKVEDDAEEETLSQKSPVTRRSTRSTKNDLDLKKDAKADLEITVVSSEKANDDSRKVSRNDSKRSVVFLEEEDVPDLSKEEDSVQNDSRRVRKGKKPVQPLVQVPQPRSRRRPNKVDDKDVKKDLTGVSHALNETSLDEDSAKAVVPDDDTLNKLPLPKRTHTTQKNSAQRSSGEPVVEAVQPRTTRGRGKKTDNEDNMDHSVTNLETSIVTSKSETHKNSVDPVVEAVQPRTTRGRGKKTDDSENMDSTIVTSKRAAHKNSVEPVVEAPQPRITRGRGKKIDDAENTESSMVLPDTPNVPGVLNEEAAVRDDSGAKRRTSKRKKVVEQVLETVNPGSRKPEVKKMVDVEIVEHSKQDTVDPVAEVAQPRTRTRGRVKKGDDVVNMAGNMTGSEAVSKSVLDLAEDTKAPSDALQDDSLKEEVALPGNSRAAHRTSRRQKSVKFVVETLKPKTRKRGEEIVRDEGNAEHDIEGVETLIAMKDEKTDLDVLKEDNPPAKAESVKPQHKTRTRGKKGDDSEKEELKSEKMTLPTETSPQVQPQRRTRTAASKQEKVELKSDLNLSEKINQPVTSKEELTMPDHSLKASPRLKLPQRRTRTRGGKKGDDADMAESMGDVSLSKNAKPVCDIYLKGSVREESNEPAHSSKEEPSLVDNFHVITKRAVRKKAREEELQDGSHAVFRPSKRQKLTKPEVDNLKPSTKSTSLQEMPGSRRSTRIGKKDSNADQEMNDVLKTETRTEADALHLLKQVAMPEILESGARSRRGSQEKGDDGKEGKTDSEISVEEVKHEVAVGDSTSAEQKSAISETDNIESRTRSGRVRKMGDSGEKWKPDSAIAVVKEKQEGTVREDLTSRGQKTELESRTRSGRGMSKKDSKEEGKVDSRISVVEETIVPAPMQALSPEDIEDPNILLAGGADSLSTEAEISGNKCNDLPIMLAGGAEEAQENKIQEQSAHKQQPSTAHIEDSSQLLAEETDSAYVDVENSSNKLEDHPIMFSGDTEEIQMEEGQLSAHKQKLPTDGAENPNKLFVGETDSSYTFDELCSYVPAVDHVEGAGIEEQPIHEQSDELYTNIPHDHRTEEALKDEHEILEQSNEPCSNMPDDNIEKELCTNIPGDQPVEEALDDEHEILKQSGEPCSNIPDDHPMEEAWNDDHKILEQSGELRSNTPVEEAHNEHLEQSGPMEEAWDVEHQILEQSGGLHRNVHVEEEHPEQSSELRSNTQVEEAHNEEYLEQSGPMEEARDEEHQIPEQSGPMEEAWNEEHQILEQSGELHSNIHRDHLVQEGWNEEHLEQSGMKQELSRGDIDPNELLAGMADSSYMDGEKCSNRPERDPIMLAGEATEARNDHHHQIQELSATVDETSLNKTEDHVNMLAGVAEDVKNVEHEIQMHNEIPEKFLAKEADFTSTGGGLLVNKPEEAVDATAELFDSSVDCLRKAESLKNVPEDIPDQYESPGTVLSNLGGVSVDMYKANEDSGVHCGDSALRESMPMMDVLEEDISSEPCDVGVVSEDVGVVCDNQTESLSDDMENMSAQHPSVGEVSDDLCPDLYNESKQISNQCMDSEAEPLKDVLDEKIANQPQGLDVHSDDMNVVSDAQCPDLGDDSEKQISFAGESSQPETKFLTDSMDEGIPDQQGLGVCDELYPDSYRENLHAHPAVPETETLHALQKDTPDLDMVSGDIYNADEHEDSPLPVTHGHGDSLLHQAESLNAGIEDISHDVGVVSGNLFDVDEQISARDVNSPLPETDAVEVEMPDQPSSLVVDSNLVSGNLHEGNDMPDQPHFGVVSGDVGDEDRRVEYVHSLLPCAESLNDVIEEEEDMSDRLCDLGMVSVNVNDEKWGVEHVDSLLPEAEPLGDDIEKDIPDTPGVVSGNVHEKNEQSSVQSGDSHRPEASVEDDVYDQPCDIDADSDDLYDANEHFTVTPRDSSLREAELFNATMGEDTTDQLASPNLYYTHEHSTITLPGTEPSATVAEAVSLHTDVTEMLPKYETSKWKGMELTEAAMNLRTPSKIELLNEVPEEAVPAMFSGKRGGMGHAEAAIVSGGREGTERTEPPLKISLNEVLEEAIPAMFSGKREGMELTEAATISGGTEGMEPTELVSGGRERMGLAEEAAVVSVGREGMGHTEAAMVSGKLGLCEIPVSLFYGRVFDEKDEPAAVADISAAAQSVYGSLFDEEVEETAIFIADESDGDVIPDTLQSKDYHVSESVPVLASGDTMVSGDADPFEIPAFLFSSDQAEKSTGKSVSGDHSKVSGDAGSFELPGFKFSDDQTEFDTEKSAGKSVLDETDEPEASVMKSGKWCSNNPEPIPLSGKLSSPAVLEFVEQSNERSRSQIPAFLVSDDKTEFNSEKSAGRSVLDEADEHGDSVMKSGKWSRDDPEPIAADFSGKLSSPAVLVSVEQSSKHSGTSPIPAFLFSDDKTEINAKKSTGKSVLDETNEPGDSVMKSRKWSRDDPEPIPAAFSSKLSSPAAMESPAVLESIEQCTKHSRTSPKTEFNAEKSAGKSVLGETDDHEDSVMKSRKRSRDDLEPIPATFSSKPSSPAVLGSFERSSKRSRIGVDLIPVMFSGDAHSVQAPVIFSGDAPSDEFLTTPLSIKRQGNVAGSTRVDPIPAVFSGAAPSGQILATPVTAKKEGIIPGSATFVEQVPAVFSGDAPSSQVPATPVTTKRKGMTPSSTTLVEQIPAVFSGDALSSQIPATPVTAKRKGMTPSSTTRVDPIPAVFSGDAPSSQAPAIFTGDGPSSQIPVTPMTAKRKGIVPGSATVSVKKRKMDIFDESGITPARSIQKAASAVKSAKSSLSVPRSPARTELNKENSEVKKRLDDMSMRALKSELKKDKDRPALQALSENRSAVAD